MGRSDPPPSPSAHRTSHTAKFAQVLIPLYFTPKHRAFGATENKGMRSGALPQFKGFIRGQTTSIYFHRRRTHRRATSPELSRCSLCSRVQAFGVDLGLRAGARSSPLTTGLRNSPALGLIEAKRSEHSEPRNREGTAGREGLMGLAAIC